MNLFLNDSSLSPFFRILQLKKERSSGRLVFSDSESVAAFSDKFIVKPKIVGEYLTHHDVVDFKKKKKKRAEERAKESLKAKEKKYEDYMLGTIYAKIQQN